MAFAAGALSVSGIQANQATLTSAVATGGTGPYDYQWYRSTTPGFTPGVGNILAGKTALSFTDTGLSGNTNYYYAVIATDTGNADATAQSTLLEVTTLMSLAIGALSKGVVGSSTAVVNIPAATGGTAPYSYQMYRSTQSGFSPGGGNIQGSPVSAGSGIVPAPFQDSGLTPGTVYYYEVIVTDSAGSPATADSAQLSVTTIAAQPNPNQFAQSPYLGQTDLYLNFNTIAVMFDPQGTGSLVGGCAVKWSANAGPVPMVVPSTAADDILAGYVNYSIKDQSFAPGSLLSISLAGNVMFLYAALAVVRGDLLTNLPAGVAGGCNGGVVPATGSSGFPIAGQALDTVAIGSLFRVMLVNSALVSDPS